MARVIFSPTTTPMLPPMNVYSIAATEVSMPFDPARRADDRVLHAGGGDRGVEPLAVRLGVDEFEGSVDCRSVSYSAHAPSKSIRSRSAAPILK
jgi:hypothetical protein